MTETVKNTSAFSRCHPVVNFLYFALVLVFSMFLMHPVSLGVSLASAAVCTGMLCGKKALLGSLRLVLPLVLFAAVVNPAFNHEGVTVLWYFPSGNPLTLESILYGLAAAVMLASVLLWFSCFNAVVTSDKFVYLFGRIIPALSLVLSMTLRFVPRFRAQLRTVTMARRGMGQDSAKGGALHKVRSGLAVLSVLITWSLENALETADSMKGRGYGLKGRTAFSIYRFDGRDKGLLLWLGFCGIFLVSAWAAGFFRWAYVPMLTGNGWNVWTVGAQAVYLALCLTPVMLNGKENAAWKRTPLKT